MRKQQYESAIKRFDSALTATEKFPSLKLAIEKALMQCWKKIQTNSDKIPIDDSCGKIAISQLLNPNISPLIDHGKYFDFIRSCELSERLAIRSRRISGN